MNRKHREKKQGEKFGTEPVMLDVETRSLFPLYDTKVGDFILQYKTPIEALEVNHQLAVYASAFDFHYELDREMKRSPTDRLFWNEATKYDVDAYCTRITSYDVVAGTMTNNVDYTSSEARIARWWADRLDRAIQRALFGDVNPFDNKPIEHVDKPEDYATSASKLTIVKIIGP